MDEQTADTLRAQAADIATRNSPLRVADNIILGTLLGIGWLIGRAWWLLVYCLVFLSKGSVAYVLALRHGYRQGSRKDLLVAAAKQIQQQIQQQNVPLTADDRIADHQTPFGVPFGPNVQAYSEPG